MRKMYFDRLSADILRFGTYMIPMVCAACKLCMHLTSTAYCLRNNIQHVADGSHVESSSLSPPQMREYLDLIDEMYSKHNIEFSTPVFQETDVDSQLQLLGLLPEQNLKSQHLVYSTQFSCFGGQMLYAYLLGYLWPTTKNLCNREFVVERTRCMIQDYSGMIEIMSEKRG